MRRSAVGRLTRSQGSYLQAIYDLARGADGVRLTDVAERLQLSKASACVAVAKLEEMGLAVRDENRRIALTPDGEREARRALDDFRVVYLFLTKKLNVDPRTARTDADALECAASEETIDALRAFLERADARQELSLY